MESGKLIAVLQGSTSAQERKTIVESTSYAGLIAAKHILTAHKGCWTSSFSILRIECELVRRDRLQPNVVRFGSTPAPVRFPTLINQPGGMLVIA